MHTFLTVFLLFADFLQTRLKTQQQPPASPLPLPRLDLKKTCRVLTLKVLPIIDIENKNEAAEILYKLNMRIVKLIT